MLEKEKLDRINELANKSKGQGLSEDEKKEQQALRQEYLAAVRKSFRNTLESITVVEEDGTQSRLKDRRKDNPKH